MAVYESYSHIDRELATLAEASRKLRSRRNTLAFPCRLPNELLVMIFSWVVVASFPGTSFDFNAPPITRWYQITHVCQRWRNVALDCPALWHQLDVTTPRWMEEALNRTRQSLLSLRAEVYAARPRTLIACKTVLASSSRIRELHVSGDFVSLQTIAASLAAGQADNLRSLIWDHAHWRASVDVFEFSTLLFKDGAPSLERLEIRGCHISFAAPLFTRSPKIETLIISGLRHATSKPLMSEVLAALESMPSLQHLYLENLLPNPSTHTPKDSCPLPAHLALQTLYLAGTVAECSYFLRHVHIPSSVAASVTCPDLDRLEDVTEFIASFCQARGEASLGTTTQPVEPLRFWSFALDPPSFLLVGSSTDGFPSPGVSPAGKELKYQQSYGLGLTINRVHHLTDTWSVMQKLLHGLPIDALSTKWIFASAFNRDALDKNCWTDLFSRLPNLESIEVHELACRHLPHALKAIGTLAVDSGHREDTSALLAAGIPVLPKLQSLAFRGFDANSFSCDEKDTVQILHALQDAQILRSYLGLPINELRLSFCDNIGPREVRTLCHLFVEVDWDGREAYTTCDLRDYWLHEVAERLGPVEIDDGWAEDDVWADWNPM